ESVPKGLFTPSKHTKSTQEVAFTAPISRGRKDVSCVERTLRYQDQRDGTDYIDNTHWIAKETAFSANNG
uniref:Uncharacterized protein n=1 Tax=Steinernema glaseri TaxID=37863 RepID=A0A1I8AQ51_9BILA